MSLGSGLLFGSLIAYGAYRVSANPKDFVFLASGCGFNKIFSKCNSRIAGNF